MGTTRSLHTCLTYLLWQPFVVSSRNAPDRCVSGALGDDTTQLRRRLSGVCLDSTNCEVVLKKESPLFFWMIIYFFSVLCRNSNSSYLLGQSMDSQVFVFLIKVSFSQIRGLVEMLGLCGKKSLHNPFYILTGIL